MDQLLEASSTQLSAFIHWYFWNMHIGPLLSFYVVGSSKLFLPKQPSLQISRIIISITVTFFFLLSLILLIHCKKNMYIEKTGENPFRKVCKVLKFAWKHKYPVNRSAFTYCEENTPSRMDLGKKQYGGPFSMKRWRMSSHSCDYSCCWCPCLAIMLLGMDLQWPNTWNTTAAHRSQFGHHM